MVYRRLLLTLLCLAALAAPILAQDAAELRRLDTGDDVRGWSAVGRLNIGKQGFCTGALITPQIVLTAGHCLFDMQTGERISADQIEFLAGWRNGQALAYRQGRRAVPHPEFAYEGAERVERVVYDLALIELDQPILLPGVVPYETDEKPRKGDLVNVVSYAHDRNDAPSLQEECKVLARQSGTLILSCNVDFGSSGAPVFVIRDGVARVVSVVSAKADLDGQPLAIVTPLGESLVAARAALEAEMVAGGEGGRTGSVRVISGGGGGGAKFVKPDGTAP
ncbi:trypsin-like serine peptidase [Neogemmobacter tilapiae]|uniref:Serine protease n=1 Tax=Neogemmobacter tilapiae TaxID=875041 RepID=A0A918TNE2_9RHOB|nr:trypsin-like serine protease [Gemmobacter tilapiae]GHC56002.1 serine protease [Gemmobacter tilapiae]